MGVAQHETCIQVLGPVQYVPVRGAAASPGAPGPQAVLAALALRAGSLVTASQLIDDLYESEPPLSARRVIINYVHRLRSRLDAAHQTPPTVGDAGGSSVIESAASGYILRLPEDSVDALRFRRLTAQARLTAASGAPATAAAVLEEALGMWHGSTLAGVPGPFADAQRRTLDEQRASALEHHLELMLECGRHIAAIPGILAALDLHPYRERLHAALMLALHRSGRTAEALAAYDRARGVLAEDLGIDTGAALKKLHADILDDDPALLVIPSPAAVRAQPLPEVPEPSAYDAGAPAQLPPPPADFVGRRQQLAAVTSALVGGDRHAVVVVTGMGGVGKTSLALRAAHAVAQDFPDGQLYAELSGSDGEPVDPADILERFLTGLGVPTASIPLRTSDRAALFRTLVFRRGVLIVLDNAVSAEQVRPLLPGAPRGGVLITARNLGALPATFRVSLDVMTHLDAMDLIGRLAGPRRVEAEGAAAAALAKTCGYLPLALRVTAARLAARPSWTVAEMLTRLSDEVRLLGELRVSDLSVEAAFEVSFSQLDPGQARAFMMLSIPHCAQWSVPHVAAVLGLPDEVAETVLEALVDAALLETRSPGRYRYHDLVGVYARTKAQTELAEWQRLEVVLCAVDFAAASVVNAVRATHPLGRPLTHEAHPRRSAGADLGTRSDAVDWVRRELPTLAALAEQAATTGSPDAIAHCADILALLPAFEESVPLTSAVRAATALVPAAEACCDEGIIGTAYYAAGVIHRNRASSTSAHAYLIKALDLFGDMPSLAIGGTRRFLAVLFALSMLSDLHLQCGDFDAARDYGRRSVSLAQTTGDRGLVARRRTILLQIEVRDPNRRTDLSRIREECRDLARTFTDGDNREWLLMVRLTEAESHCQEGDHTRAARLYGRVLEWTRVSGHARIETECLYRLAETLLATGDTGAALDHASRALAGALLAQENLLMARSHEVFGRTLRALGDEAGAAEHLGKTAGLHAELGLRPNAQAMSTPARGIAAAGSPSAAASTREELPQLQQQLVDAVSERNAHPCPAEHHER